MRLGGRSGTLGSVGAPRVVSLVPSATETLLAWGVRPVAVTRFCDAPGIPTVGGTKNPDTDRIIGLRPDLVVLCEEENRLEDARVLEAAGLVTCTLEIRSVADVAGALDRLAAALGLGAPPVPVGPPPEPEAVRAPVFVPIWRRPWMTLGSDTYGGDLLARLGFPSVFADHPDRYPVVTLEDAVVAGARAVVVPDEPYPFGPRHVDELSVVGPVVPVDGRDLFWWGVRTPAAVDRLRRVLDRSGI